MKAHTLMLAALLLGPACAFAASTPQKVTILFTGDNGGEVSPCG